jgi:hypothetical protein
MLSGEKTWFFANDYGDLSSFAPFSFMENSYGSTVF